MTNSPPANAGILEGSQITATPPETEPATVSAIPSSTVTAASDAKSVADLQNGTTKRSRSPSASSDLERPRKHASATIVCETGVEAGLTMKHAMEIALRAAKCVAEPLDKRISVIEQCTSKMVRLNIDVVIGITALAMRQEFLVKFCAQNREELEQLQRRQEQIQKVSESNFREQVKEYTEYYNQVRADNEALKQRIKNLEAELILAKVQYGVHIQYQRNLFMAELRTLLTDWTEEMMNLEGYVDERKEI